MSDVLWCSNLPSSSVFNSIFKLQRSLDFTSSPNNLLLCLRRLLLMSLVLCDQLRNVQTQPPAQLSSAVSVTSPLLRQHLQHRALFNSLLELPPPLDPASLLRFCSLNPLGTKHRLLTFQADLLLMVPLMMILPLMKNPTSMFHLMEKELCSTLLALMQNNWILLKQSS